MSYLTIGPELLLLVPVYAATFFWGPNTVASYIDVSGRPTHEVMQDFRIWQRRRVWVTALGFGACLIASLFGADMMFLIALFAGLMALSGADALQSRSLARDHQNLR